MKRNLLCLLCFLANNLSSSNNSNNLTNLNKRTFEIFSTDNNEKEINENSVIKKRKFIPKVNALNAELGVLKNQLLEQSSTMAELVTKDLLVRFLAAIVHGNENNLATLFSFKTFTPQLQHLFMNSSTALLVPFENSKEVAERNELLKCAQNPLTYAINQGQFPIASLLISKGASLTPPNVLPIVHLIVSCSTPENTPATIKLLTEIFTDNPNLIDSRDYAGKPPLFYAIAKLNNELVNFLIERGANVTIRDNKNQTGFHLLALASTHDDDDEQATQSNDAIKKIFEALVNAGLPVDKKNKKGYTALQLASKQGCSSLVKLLLINGANPNKETKNGLTPLQLSSNFAGVGTDHSSYSTIAPLIEFGAQIDQQKKNKNSTTPLQYTIKNGDLTPFSLLLSEGATLSIPRDGRIQKTVVALTHPLLKEYFNKESKGEVLMKLLREKNKLCKAYNPKTKEDVSAQFIFNILANAALIKGDQLFGGSRLSEKNKLELNFIVNSQHILGECTTIELDSLIKKLILCLFIPLASMKDSRKFPLQQNNAIKSVYFTKAEFTLFQDIFQAISKDPRFTLMEKIPNAIAACTYLQNNLQKTAKGCTFNKTFGVAKKDMRIKFDSFLPLPRE